MPLVAAKCTECGGAVQVDSEKKAAVCENCGNAFIVEEAITNFNNQYFSSTEIRDSVVNIYGSDGVKAETLLKRISILCGDGDWVNANKIAEQVLALDPENAEAYYYLLLCSFQAKSIKDLLPNKERILTSLHYKHALEFAKDNFREDLIALGHEIKMILQSESQFLKSEIEELNFGSDRLKKEIKDFEAVVSELADNAEEQSNELQRLRYTISPVYHEEGITAIGFIGLTVMFVIGMGLLILAWWYYSFLNDPSNFGVWFFGIPGLILVVSSTYLSICSQLRKKKKMLEQELNRARTKHYEAYDKLDGLSQQKQGINSTIGERSERLRVVESFLK